ncbi:MAG: RDD family protein [Rhodocyclaceae bacterium]|nr:RDD family protein [Rhodocyclaceae bacterium]
MTDETIEYGGFWIRVGASLIDTLLMLCIIVPLLIAIYGWSYFAPAQTGFIAGIADFLLSYILPAVAVILFWMYRQATPGKMMLKLKVVDAKTGGPLTLGQSIIRYIGYYVSSIPLCIGLIWVGLDARKQGWHDKMAGTVVIRTRKR